MQEVQDVPSGIFSYGGAHTFAAISAIVNPVIAQTYPAFQLRYTEPYSNKPGSGTGIAMLLDKHLSFAHSGRPLKDEEYAKAKIRGFKIQQVPVALDAIAFYTHPKINVPGLSIRQVQAIFTGKITNWKQVGGPNLLIQPFAVDPKLTSAVQILFEGIDNAQLGRNVRIMRDYTEIIRQVAAIPGSISYGSAPLVQGQKTIRLLGLSKGNSKQYVQLFTPDDKVNEAAIRDGSYPLSRRLFVVIRRDGTLDEQGGLAYTNLLLSQEGQRLIQQAGFVPLLGTR
jgi:phosphate transport system substrate-binding protein